MYRIFDAHELKLTRVENNEQYTASDMYEL
jgi:hypothetical protein